MMIQPIDRVQQVEELSEPTPWREVGKRLIKAASVLHPDQMHHCNRDWGQIYR